MAVIPLNKGYSVVDDEYHKILMTWLWSAKRQRNYLYACRNRVPNDSVGATTIYLHQEVLRLSSTDIPDGFVIDHVNRNALDNRLLNLRVVTVAQNARNATQRTSKSGYLGVRWDNKAAYWMAYIKIDGREKFICYTNDKETAAMYRDKAALKQYENATLNFPELAYQQGFRKPIPDYVLTHEDTELLRRYEADNTRMNIRYGTKIGT